MSLLRLDVDEGQIVLHTERTVCSTTQELVESQAFARVVDMYLDRLAVHNSSLLSDLDVDPADFGRRARLLDHLRLLANNPIERLAGTSPEGAALLERRAALHQFVEGLYDYWRGFDRFMVSHSEAGPAAGDRRPYRAFNETVGVLGDLVRGLYRDVAENITGEHPRVYRQVAAGAEVGVIAVQIAFLISGNILILRGFFASIPAELQDAAYIDGCTAFGFFWRILLPLARPALAAVAALTMVVSWNDLLVPLVVIDKDSLWTLPLGTMQFQGQYGQDLALVAAFVTLSAIPAVVFYLIAERQIVSGLTAGALKG